LKLLVRKLKSQGCRVTLLTGARTEDLLYREELPGVDELILATDDGSKGIRGPVTGALEAVLDENSAGVTLYAAGPKPMLRRVADLAELYEVSCELSLESFMACGIGACYGCVVKALDEDGEQRYVRVCREGPVFDSRRIVSFED
jgi:dihydroorotate dehydrogenase electron transfer subunit